MDPYKQPETERYRRFLHQKFIDFLTDKEVRDAFKKDNIRMDLITHSLSIFGTTDAINNIEMKFLRDLEVELTKLQKHYEYLKSKPVLPEQIDISSDDDNEVMPASQEQAKENYVHVNTIPWRKPRRIPVVIPPPLRKKTPQLPQSDIRPAVQVPPTSSQMIVPASYYQAPPINQFQQNQQVQVVFVPVNAMQQMNPMVPIFYPQQVGFMNPAQQMQRMTIPPPAIQNPPIFNQRQAPPPLSQPPPPLSQPPPRNYNPNFNNNRHSRFSNPNSSTYPRNSNSSSSFHERDRDRHSKSNVALSYKEHKEMQRKKLEEEEERKKREMARRQAIAKRVEEANRKFDTPNSRRNEPSMKSSRLSDRDRDQSRNRDTSSSHSRPPFKPQSDSALTTSARRESQPSTSQSKPHQSGKRPQEEIKPSPSKRHKSGNVRTSVSHVVIRSRPAEKEKTPEKTVDRPVSQPPPVSEADKYDSDDATVSLPASDYEDDNNKEMTSSTVVIKQEVPDIDDRSVSSGATNDSGHQIQIKTEPMDDDELPPLVNIKCEVKEEEEDDETINNDDHEADTNPDEVEETSTNESFYQRVESMFKEEEFIKLFINARPRLEPSRDLMESAVEKVQSWMQNNGNISPNYDQPERSPIAANENSQDSSDNWIPQGECFDDDDNQSIIPYNPSSQIAPPIKREMCD